MESKEYRLEEYSGEIYTWEEFKSKYVKVVPDTGIIGAVWDTLL